MLPMCGFTSRPIALATMRLGTVPHAMGLIRPLGLRSGIMRAEAIAPKTSRWAWPVASSVSTWLRASRAAGLVAVIA